MTSTAERLGDAAPTQGELDLLRAALAPTPVAARAWAHWRSANDVLTATHRSHEIFPAISANLPGDVLGEDYLRLKGLRRNTWVSNQLILDSLAAALDVLGARDISAVVIKGASLVTSAYPKPGVRRLADADLVVPLPRFGDAMQALEQHGWSQHGEARPHAVTLIGPTGRELDLHRWCMFPRFCRYEESTWYRRSAPSTLLGRHVSRLRPSDELVLVVTHGLRTVGGSNVRWPLDVAAIERSSRSSQTATGLWDEVIASARELGLGQIVADGLSLCVEEFGLEIPQDCIPELRSQPLDLLLRAEWDRRKSGKRALVYRRYVDMRRAEGEPGTVLGYLEHRWSGARDRGFRTVLRNRTERVLRSLGHAGPRQDTARVVVR